VAGGGGECVIRQEAVLPMSCYIGKILIIGHIYRSINIRPLAARGRTSYSGC
jgi:hypothetical protein